MFVASEQMYLAEMRQKQQFQWISAVPIQKEHSTKILVDFDFLIVKQTLISGLECTQTPA